MVRGMQGRRPGRASTPARRTLWREPARVLDAQRGQHAARLQNLAHVEVRHLLGMRVKNDEWSGWCEVWKRARGGLLMCRPCSSCGAVAGTAPAPAASGGSPCIPAPADGARLALPGGGDQQVGGLQVAVVDGRGARVQVAAGGAVGWAAGAGQVSVGVVRGSCKQQRARGGVHASPGGRKRACRPPPAARQHAARPALTACPWRRPAPAPAGAASAGARRRAGRCARW